MLGLVVFVGIVLYFLETLEALKWWVIGGSIAILIGIAIIWIRAARAERR